MVALRKRNGHDGQGGHGLQARLNSLRGDLGALQNDMRGLMKDVGGAASEQVQGVVDGANQSAREAADFVESWGSENMPRMHKMVRSQPFAASAIALSVGALLGVFLFRR